MWGALEPERFMLDNFLRNATYMSSRVFREVRQETCPLSLSTAAFPLFCLGFFCFVLSAFCGFCFAVLFTPEQKVSSCCKHFFAAAVSEPLSPWPVVIGRAAVGPCRAVGVTQAGVR